MLKQLETARHKASIAPGDMAVFEKSPVKPQQLNSLTLYDLRLLRNEVYARRGYHFYKKWLLDHFASEEWYKPSKTHAEPKLTAVEEQNVDTILRQENSLHAALLAQPIKEDSLDGLYSEDAKRLRYEIQARHGKRFSDPWLASYFASMPWYKPNGNYSDKLLSKVERANIEKIKAYEMQAASEFKLVEG